MDSNEFIASLPSIRWFSALGSSTTATHRISDWGEWPGPEDENVGAIGSVQEEFYDSFCDSTSLLPPSLQAVWDVVQEHVLDAAKLTIPYDQDQDVWHPPNAAVWQAAYTAGLVALYLATRRPIPEQLKEQWNWFTLGHWPCSYVDFESEIPQFVVY